MSARAAMLFGRESVTKADSAVIELVKNSYDADADFSYIKFNLQEDSLYILDNGIGMTEEVIDNYWMTIGTDNKVLNYESSKSRIKSGEKGVGRLSLDRLGEICEMYTKNKSENLNYWKSNFTDFDAHGTLLEDIDVDFQQMNRSFIDILPLDIINDLHSRDLGIDINKIQTGTLLIIKNLRDKWNDKKIVELFNSLTFLLPPKDYSDYELIVFDPNLGNVHSLKNEIATDYDYKVHANFDGERFKLEIIRNEFDINKLPLELMDKKYIRDEYVNLDDISKGRISNEYTTEQMLKKKSAKHLEILSKIGPFEFNFIFMKMSNSKEDQSYYVKDIGRNRKKWLDLYSGVKIYRDNFIVRPYGFIETSSYDWLGLDRRKSQSPASPSHPSKAWKTRNKQIQGTLSISRVTNPLIKDIASRESLVDNDELKILKEVIHNIIEIFEKDRSTLFSNIRQYNEELNENEKTKNDADKIARQINRKTEENRKRKEVDLSKASPQVILNLYNETSEKNKTMAKAIDLFKNEKKDLYTELKLLRELSTSGLITSSIVHDLKTLSSNLESRAITIKEASEINETEFDNTLKTLQTDDHFLKSWIQVIMNQDSNKRKKLKHDLRVVFRKLINLIEPILTKKNIEISLVMPTIECNKNIYESDFNSIFYNLIINSIESFESKSRDSRRIIIELTEENNKIKVIYSDNGYGIPSELYKSKNDIFNYGITSKVDRNGEKAGTGLGMYIVSSTLNEYSAEYELVDDPNGFKFEITFN